MSKNMQKIVLFIDPNDLAWFTPLKIGNLFMNRFAVDEEAASEVLKIFELKKETSFEKSNPDLSYKKFIERRKQKGTDLINLNWFEFVSGLLIEIKSCFHFKGGFMIKMVGQVSVMWLMKLF